MRAAGVRISCATVLLAAVGFPGIGVTRAQNAPPPPQRVRAKLDGFDLSPKTGRGPNQVGGASRDLGQPALYAPNLGKMYTLTPEFHWSAAQPGDKVTFRLSTADGEKLYETTLTTDHLRYPSDAPALKPGDTYRWTIVPENDVLGGAPRPVSFMVVSGPEREEIAQQLKAAGNASTMAVVFVNHRIWYDAIQDYSEALMHNPGDQNALAARADLYEQLPVTKPLADADWHMVH